MEDIYKTEEDILLEPEVEDISTETCLTCQDDMGGNVAEPVTVGLPTTTDTTLGVGGIDMTCEPDAITNMCMDNMRIGEYFGTLQESVVTIWKLHLQTKKHFMHVELDNLYHNMLHYVDSLIEQYMGCVCDVIKANEYVNVLFYNDTTELAYLIQLRNFVLNGRNILFGSLTEICSVIDDIVSSLDSTIYKLNAFSENEPPVQTFETYCYEHFKSLDEDCEFNSDDDEEE